MDLGCGRGYAMQPAMDPAVLIQQKPAAERSWRMQQIVLSSEEHSEALSKASSRSRHAQLEALALCLKARFNSAGYGMPPELLQQIGTLVAKMRSDPQNFTRTSLGNGRETVMCAMKPGDYVLLQVAEVYTMWTMHVSGRKNADLRGVSRNDVAERIHTTLMRLSGNMSSTIRDAQARLSQAANTAAVTMIPLGDGLTAPADVVIATQLREFGLHPKQLAWVLHELAYELDCV